MSTSGCRRLWAFVQGLPPEAMVWQDRPVIAVTPPSPLPGMEQRPGVVTDPNDIKAFFAKNNLT